MIKGGLKIKGIEEYGSKINCSLSIKYGLSKGYLPRVFSCKITADQTCMIFPANLLDNLVQRQD